MNIPPKDITRFLGKIEVTSDGCWKWTGHCDEAGYPQFWYDHRMLSARQFSHMVFKGLALNRSHLDGCKEHWCVHPAHMEVKVKATA